MDSLHLIDYTSKTKAQINPFTLRKDLQIICNSLKMQKEFLMKH